MFSFSQVIRYNGVTVYIESLAQENISGKIYFKNETLSGLKNSL